MTPLQRYQSDLQKKGFEADARQRQAVQKTQRVFAELNIAAQHKKSFFAEIFKPKTKPVKGLYLWGGTGRGKTYLVDSFYECLPGDKKHRVHFHRFMLEIHEELRNFQNLPNPLEIIAKQQAEKLNVLCLDEFHVHDIADAMLLAGLLKAMFEQGITLVATSNIPIDDLYKNGLQRERFMYAIELLKEYTEEVDLGNGTDYRFNILGESEHLFIIDEKNTEVKGKDFLSYKLIELSPCKPKHNRSIEINNRNIEYIALADDVIWFDYSELFCTARSAHDYIEIAERFHTVLLSDIEVMHEKDDSAAKRFIHCIDALYDHNVKLLATAFAPPHELYHGKRLNFAFDRTISRLTEMGAEQYLKLAHNPTGTTRTLIID